MSRTQLHFFGTKTDLESVISSVQSQVSLSYTLAGLFDSSKIQYLDSLLNTPDLGVSTADAAVRGRRYLVFPSKYKVLFSVRAVPQRKGGKKYAVDQMANPKTIVFSPGGVFGEGCIIAGDVGTISEDSVSLEVFGLFSKAIRQEFVKIQSYYVGKEAKAGLDSGWRLTANAKSDQIYDLRLPGLSILP